MVKTFAGAPRVDYVTGSFDDLAKLTGVEVKYGNAPLTAVQKAGYGVIENGGVGIASGSRAMRAGIEGQAINAIETLRFGPWDQALTLTPAIAEGVGASLGYPSNSNANIMHSVYRK